VKREREREDERKTRVQWGERKEQVKKRTRELEYNECCLVVVDEWNPLRDPNQPQVLSE
jgi:hypothetical protein